MFSELSPGSPFWLPQGHGVCNALVALRGRWARARGYREVKTPHALRRRAVEDLGHWDKYREHMYFTEVEERRWASSR